MKGKNKFYSYKEEMKSLRDRDWKKNMQKDLRNNKTGTDRKKQVKK